MTVSARHIFLDAEGQSLGRLASNVARTLRGKHRPDFTPNLLPGVHVTVKNLRKLRLGVRQLERPVRHFSGYPGGLKSDSFENVFRRNPDQAFRRVVRRMLPDNRLRQRMLRFLHTTE